MKFKLKDIDKKWKEYALAGCVCILFFVIISHIGLVLGYIGSFLGIFKSVFLGAVFAYIINPLAMFFKRTVFGKLRKEKPKWICSVVLSLVIILLLIVLLAAAFIPQMIDSAMSLIDNAGTYVDNLSVIVENLGDEAGEYLDTAVNFIIGEEGLVNRIVSLLKTNLKGIIKITSNFGSTAVTWGIAAIFAIYFLLAKESFKGAADHLISLLLSPAKYYNAMFLLNKFHTIFSKYIVCEIVDALIVGVSNYIFMLICGMPNAVLISVIVAVTNLAPTFGPIVGAAFGACVLVLVAPKSALIFLIFTVVIQTIDAYVIKPKFFGDALNVPGVIILIAIIVFGKLLGVAGMLIAIPIAAILVYIYSEAFIPWLELRRDLKKYSKDDSEISLNITTDDDK